MEKEENKIPELSDFKGNPLITLNPGAKFIFQFGLSKAKIIIDNYEYIKKFYETKGKSLA